MTNTQERFAKRLTVETGNSLRQAIELANFLASWWEEGPESISPDALFDGEQTLGEVVRRLAIELQGITLDDTDIRLMIWAINAKKVPHA